MKSEESQMVKTVNCRPQKGFATTFSALKHRNYRLFFTGQLISLIGTWMQNVAQSWLVYQLTGSPIYLGIVSVASSVPILAFSLGAGVLIDRVDKRKLIIVTQAAAMALAFILSADVFLGFVQPWHIIILSFLLGTVNAIDAPARQAFLIDMVAREDLMNGIALNSAIFNAARVIGPSLAGITLAAIGAGWCFFLNGVSFIAVIISLLLMRVAQKKPEVHKGSMFVQLVEGLIYIWKTNTIRTIILLLTITSLFAYGYSALLPAFAKDVLNAGPEGLGLLSASIGMGALIGALTIASLGHFKRKGLLLTIGNLGFPLLAILFAFSMSFIASMVLLVGIGVGFMVQNSMSNSLVQQIVPDHLRGRVMSVYMLVFQGFFPIGSLISTSIAQEYGAPMGAAIGASVALMAGVVFLFAAPYLRKLE